METRTFSRHLPERDLFYAFLRMPAIDQVSAVIVQPELMSGESILWAGQPQCSVIFHKEDSFLIPFSLLWGGFAIFWEASVAGLWSNHSNSPASLFILWGIPFVVIGQYLIWGRFVYAGWLKRRTYYAVTNRRVLVIQNGWKRQIAAAYIDSLPSLIKAGGSSGIGILRFGPSQSMWFNNRGWGVWNALSVADQPTFVDINDVDTVYRLVSDLRERSRATKPTSQIPSNAGSI
jgi:hypothetical protein